VFRKAKHVCCTFLLLVVTYEITLFISSTIAEHSARNLTELIATLKPGSTTKTDAIASFKAHKWNATLDEHACSVAEGSCEGLSVGASNFPRTIPLHLGRLAGITLLPLPPVKTAYFGANLYFINGILNSINVAYRVGITGVGYSRYAGGQNYSMWSRCKDETGDMVRTINVASSGTDSDVPFPRFVFKYMYSVKRIDAQKLWPTAPPPTTEDYRLYGCG